MVSPTVSSASTCSAVKVRNGTACACAARGVSNTCAPSTVKASAPRAAPLIKPRRSMSSMVSSRVALAAAPCRPSSQTRKTQRQFEGRIKHPARLAAHHPRKPNLTTASNLGAAPAGPTRHERVPLGILYMVSAGLVFAVSSAVSKWLVATYPVGEVLFSRAVVSLVALGLFILPGTGLSVFHTRRPGAHVMRGLSQATSQTLLVIAFSLMPLASATAINFSAPLFATLVSILLLKEGVGAARWTALAVGFLGVLLVTSPGADTFQTGAVYALANAVLFGTVTAGVRGMTATESTE